MARSCQWQRTEGTNYTVRWLAPRDAGSAVRCGEKRGRNPSFETRADLKTRSRKADTDFVDAAERKEILNRYRDHSRRFEAAAARRGSTRTGSVIPFAPAVQREFEQEPTAREIEVLAARG